MIIGFGPGKAPVARERRGFGVAAGKTEKTGEGGKSETRIRQASLCPNNLSDGYSMSRHGG